ncbi:MAG: hypothetical protein M1833_006688 [Piccolia ochrophora]|nr:MAG: hypothetical protein M1833_006688 [Piccolia ochrophora]
MGEPNISSILAALAAQRPAGTPTQGRYQAPQNAHPQVLPQGYAGNLSSSTPPASLGGFQLPQPTNSGSLDLSSIKPTNSGSVSIAEAIAKARGIAAEKGVSYDSRGTPNRDLDPRALGRSYGASRSRSRSPPPTRRENFRDNYNPYRDERREDRRGGAGGRDFQRDRSYSPAPRDRRGGNSAFSTPPSSRTYGAQDERSPRGGTTDDNVETIQIDSSLVGLIIGRQGENLRRVETDTGARVQFVTGPDVNGPSRGCKITGTRQARNDAKAEIYRIVDENGRPGAAAQFDRGAPAPQVAQQQAPLREGEDNMQIMVPDRTVGLIIGRGGETIRDLQERSGCHVNIVGEHKSVNGLRPVNLIGTPQSASTAKDLIMEIVDSDTKTLASQGPPPKEAPPRTGGFGGTGGGGYGGGDRINDTIRVPSEAVGMIIGKGGETIKDMQNNTGCKINVSQQSGPGEVDREIGLVGSRDSIEQAKQAIEEKVDFVKRGSRPQHQDPYSDRQAQTQQQYGQGQAQAQQPSSTEDQGSDADPYAAYGGYNNYVAMWYAAMAQQQQQQQGQGEQPRPPGAA